MRDLSVVLKAVREEFESAPAWTDPSVKVRQRYKRPGGHAGQIIAVGERTEMPPDPFMIISRLPDDPAGDGARLRYYQPAGRALALQARMYSAKSADEVVISVQPGPPDALGQTVIVTATPKGRA